MEEDIGKSELEKTKRNGGSSEAIIRQSEEVGKEKEGGGKTIQCNYIQQQDAKSELKKE